VRRRSRLQRRAALRARTRLRTRARGRRGPVTLTCARCGATFRRIIPARRSDGPAFCSRRCARLHREEQRAPQAPAPQHSRSWWARLRAYVRARDGFRCALCGIPERDAGGPLHVDHVYPRRAFRRALDAYLELGPSGFVSLCPACHARKTHTSEAAWLAGDAIRLQDYVRAIATTGCRSGGGGPAYPLPAWRS
jgi:hypothetical protein